MDQKKLINWQRHDFVFVSRMGRDRICTELAPFYKGEALELVKDVFSENYGQNGIPGIVRRADKCGENFIPVGFVPLARLNDRRLRVGAFTHINEVSKIIVPFEILKMDFPIRNNCLTAVQLIKELGNSQDISLGILGSAGLEIVTGCAYTNAASDVDLLIKGCEIEKLADIYQKLKAICNKLSVPIDLEVQLANGYGVKAAELFMESKTILGKSLKDVVLLNRKEVLEALKKEK